MPNSRRRSGPATAAPAEQATAEPAAERATGEPAAAGSGDPVEPADPPLNRAERRAQRRGRQPTPPPVGKGPVTGHHDQVVVPRRSGRRGNR
jgi:hypothetical protein